MSLALLMSMIRNPPVSVFYRPTVDVAISTWEQVGGTKDLFYTSLDDENENDSDYCWVGSTGTATIAMRLTGTLSGGAISHGILRVRSGCFTSAGVPATPGGSQTTSIRLYKTAGTAKTITYRTASAPSSGYTTEEFTIPGTDLEEFLDGTMACELLSVGAASARRIRCSKMELEIVST